MDADERGIKHDLSQSLGYTTAGANEPPPVFLINPLRQRWTLRLLRAVMVTVMFALCGLCAAMFTEPAITQIEEVGRLVHRAAIYTRLPPRLR